MSDRKGIISNHMGLFLPINTIRHGEKPSMWMMLIAMAYGNLFLRICGCGFAIFILTHFDWMPYMLSRITEQSIFWQPCVNSWMSFQPSVESRITLSASAI